MLMLMFRLSVDASNYYFTTKRAEFCKLEGKVGSLVPDEKFLLVRFKHSKANLIIRTTTTKA